MPDNPELLRLRHSVRVAEDRYRRLQIAHRDSALLAAARGIWNEATEALRA